MSAKPVILACFLLAVANAQADDPLKCGTSLGERLAREFPPGDALLDNPDTVILEAGSFEAQLGASPTARMSGGVLLRRDDKLAGADAAHYDPEQRALFLEGGVRYEDPGTQILSRSAEFGYDMGRIRFEGAEFSLGSSNARGAADSLEINESGTLTLGGVEYTTCPPGSEDWLLQGKSIELDTRAGIGTAKGMRLQFKSVPILYLPYISFPIGDARKSGVLTPEIGSSGRSGNEIRVPYYWNIAPNYDATITPRLLTSRGLQLETQFRYLTPRNEGTVTADYLPDDDKLNRTRHQVRFGHRTIFGNGWRNRINFREVSDSQYFEDLGGSLSISSITHLDRNVSFDYYSDRLALFAQVQDYQTIDDAIAPSDEPYRRLPQVLVSANLPMGPVRFGIDSELVNFDRDSGSTGWRFNAAPSVELSLGRPGLFLKPAVALDYTTYDLSDTPPGQDTTPERTVPISSVDTGLILERTMANANRIQTIEPRLLYVHVPFRDQSGYPVFDTIAPDINLVQLYRKNRFLGVDRIGDTDQLSVGVTSRVLDVSSGRELMSATVGQTRYFSDRMVTLPNTSAATFETSDYIAQLRFLLFENVNFDFGHQWGTGESGTTKSEARLQYSPERNKILNLAYRFRRDSLEQGDLSWSWPVAKQWNFVGRYNFSFRDQEVLEQFFGLEYESCCWGLRLVSRRHISTRDGTRDSSFGLQLVLKGMTSVGTAADKLLERGILGYSADLR
ncbi:MAG: LPS assembly protein LptD [Woeseiaceae bacterium]|nr:LPS assembly protein LptD [Woeseiaceae bacterium]